MSLTRTETDIIGSFASPASIAAAGSASGTVDLAATSGTIDAALAVTVIVGTSPSASPTVAFFYSLDGTHFIQDGGAISVPVTSSTSTPVGPYVPPPAVLKAQVKVTNADTGSVAITAWAQGTTLASSNL